MVLGAIQGCCSLLVHITLSGSALKKSQKRWDPNAASRDLQELSWLWLGTDVE